MTAWPRAAALVAVLVGGLMLLPAGPAHADPARPTNYRSQVSGLEPDTGAVRVEVVGGDAFLRLTVQSGHIATVYGYRDEPYLRIDEDGTVHANLNSPAYYLNEDRYAAVPLPDRADPEADPDWAPVASDGSYAWHDHRIHWMTPDVPRSVRPGGGVQAVTEVSPWEVPLAIDDTPTVVRGELLWVPTNPPIVPVVVGLLAAMVGWLAVARSRRAAGAALAAAAAAVTAAAFGEAAVQPAGAAAAWGNWLPPALALVLALAATAAPRSDKARAMLVLAGAAGGVWVVIRASTLWLPVLPTVLPESAARALVATGAGIIVGALLGTGTDALRTGTVSGEPTEPAGGRPAEAQ